MFGPAQSPDAPQKIGSVLGSTQRPPQSTCPLGQRVSQLPAAQTWPDMHVTPASGPVQVPDAPQRIGSVLGSTQRPPQFTCPAGQLVAQAPPAQT